MSANFSGFLIYEIFCAKEVLMLRFCSSLAGPTVVYYRRSSQLFKLFTVKTPQGVRYNITNEVVIGALLLPGGLGGARELTVAYFV
jgi:hypothetical protein